MVATEKIIVKFTLRREMEDCYPDSLKFYGLEYSSKRRVNTEAADTFNNVPLKVHQYRAPGSILIL